MSFSIVFPFSQRWENLKKLRNKLVENHFQPSLRITIDYWYVEKKNSFTLTIFKINLYFSITAPHTHGLCVSRHVDKLIYVDFNPSRDFIEYLSLLEWEWRKKSPRIPPAKTRHSAHRASRHSQIKSKRCLKWYKITNYSLNRGALEGSQKKGVVE